MKSKIKNEDKDVIIHDLNNKIGSDINTLEGAYEIEAELRRKKKDLESLLHVANDEVPTKLSSALKKAENNSKQILNLKSRSVDLKKKLEEFLKKTEPLRSELNKRFSDISKLEGVLCYLKSFEKIDDLSRQMKQCNDDEQLVQLYGELKAMCYQYKKGHQAAYVKDYTHFWHNILKDKLTKHYEDVMKQLKWPFTASSENSPPQKDVLLKFNNLTRYLFLIQEPEDLTFTAVSDEFDREQDPCLSIKVLLRPLKKRFMFHFTGNRQTARIDRPEWFLTQTLTWIKDHQTFIKNNVQPVANKLGLKNVNAVLEFNAGVIAFAAERLHTVLALYHSHGIKGEIVDVDAAFAHAVDETLGFHRELIAVTESDYNSVLSVLTKAETFVRWLAVEKKYALAKMDETLGNEQWSEPVAAGVGAAVGSVLWVPRSADWFITLLKTIEDRYSVLPQPGHRLQFLELQLELIEEWRIRLTQLLAAAVNTLQTDSFLTASSPHPLTAVINAAHYTRTVLLEWAHSLHYLQLHFYRRQFQHFTQQQHRDEESESFDSSESDDDDDDETDESDLKKPMKTEPGVDEMMSLNELELRAKRLALDEMSRRSSAMYDITQYDTTPIANLAVTEPLSPDTDLTEEAGVFGEAPALLAHLQDAGLSALVEHILLEFKATIRDYKKQKWHAMIMVEEVALSVSSTLCGPLSALCARLSSGVARLAPALAAKLRAHLAGHLDQYLLEEMVLETWFNTGGTIQFTHDVKRNLIPAFAPPHKTSSQAPQLPKLLEACELLNMDYDDARRLRSTLFKQPSAGADSLLILSINHIEPHQALKILNQRTDLSDNSSPSSVMELF